MPAEQTLPAWSTIGQPAILPGYAYGFCYPCAMVHVAVPALAAAERDRLGSGWFALFDGIPDLPDLPAAPAEGPEEADRMATIRWFCGIADRLLALAALPVTQQARCIGVNAVAASFAVPGLAQSTQPLGQLLALAARFFAAELPNGDDGAAFKSACQEQFTRLRQSNFPAANTPRLVRAASENGIAFQEIPFTQTIQFGLGRKAVLFNSTFTQFTSTVGARLARNKVEAAAVLRRNRLPVPQHGLVRNAEQAHRIAEILGYPVVVKPADQDGGIAVSADIRTGEELEKAFHRAREKSANVLVEQFIPGRDYRLQVFRGRCVWAIERVPASVTGDGVSTIERLVAIANADPRRGDGPHSPLKRLKLDDEALELLQRDGLSLQSIPAQGAFVKLRRASNVGSGGMPVNVMDQAHPDNALLAERAAQALKLDVAGVDLIMPDISVSWKEVGGMICEVNAQPQFGGTTALHLYPLLLQTMLGGNGHVPVVAIAGGAEAEQVSRHLAEALAQMGIRAGLHSRAGIAIGRHEVEQGQIGQLAAGQMLSLNQAVDVLLFGATGATVLQEGFPVPRIDALLLTGEPLDREGLQLPDADDVLAFKVLRMLAPSARGVFVLDSAAGPGDAIKAALGALSLPDRRIALDDLADALAKMHRAGLEPNAGVGSPD